MLAALVHRQDREDLWRPRRPVVCVIDVAGFLSALLVIAHGHEYRTVVVIAAAIALQYVLSCLYHYLPYSRLLQTLDHAGIVLLIAGSFIPYWAAIVAPEDLQTRLWILGALVAGGIVFKIALLDWDKIGSALYLSVGGFGVTVSIDEFLHGLPAHISFGFWTGAILYLVQFAVYFFEWPEVRKDLFGYRELQHSILLMATTTHMLVALQLT